MPAGTWKLQEGFRRAITPDGIENELPSLIHGLEKVILLHCPEGFPVQKILEPAMERLLDAGFDLEAYYCPMDPAKKLEHIVVPDAGFAIVTCNSYHTVKADSNTQKSLNITLEVPKNVTLFYRRSVVIWKKALQEDLKKALALLKNTRRLHDELERLLHPLHELCRNRKNTGKANR